VETMKNVAKQLSYEKLNKRIFVTILLIILALQPLWLLFVYR